MLCRLSTSLPIHDPHPPGHNPHAHVLLTMRAMDEHGKWLPKVPAIDAAVRGVEGFGLRFVRAAPAGGLSVQKFFGPGGEAQIEREFFVGGVLGVHDAEDGLACALAQPGVHALVPALAGHPLEAAGVILARIEGGLISPAREPAGAGLTFNRSVRPTSSSTVRTPSLAM